MLHADGFRRRDLDVVDVLAPPRRLEHPVGETHRHDALDRFLAQKMVDAVELRFVALFENLRVEVLRALQIVAERLFDDHAPEAFAVLLEQAVLAELIDNRTPKNRAATAQIEYTTLRPSPTVSASFV